MNKSRLKRLQSRIEEMSMPEDLMDSHIANLFPMPPLGVSGKQNEAEGGFCTYWQKDYEQFLKDMLKKKKVSPPVCYCPYSSHPVILGGAAGPPPGNPEIPDDRKCKDCEHFVDSNQRDEINENCKDYP